MRGLFLKIFVIFWIAQSLIFVISTALIVRHHFDGPDYQVSLDTIKSSLQHDAAVTAIAWERGGCQGVQSFGNILAQSIALEDTAGKVLCNPSGIEGLGTHQVTSPRSSGSQIGEHYIWRVPVTLTNGHQYVFLLSRQHVPLKPSWYMDLLRFSFPQLPVAIVIGGLTTFALVLLFTRPVARLRQAARELAMGKLNARVSWPASQSRIFSGDEIFALMHDFNYMAERLESLVDAQKLLLRDVSHELRSPLARLSVALELAREDVDPASTAHLDRIERETERLNQLIGQLLSLSSMEAINKVENFKSLSLNSLIESMIPDAAFEATQRQSSLTFHSDAQCTVAGNHELLYRAIENIVRNAIRYTESGSEVDITLRAATTLSGSTAVIEVADRGPGIPENQLGAIFRPFYRVDYARSPDTGGFGVGLAIAERAVRLHHGELRAFNRSGGGATIRITLPAIAVASIVVHA